MRFVRFRVFSWIAFLIDCKSDPRIYTKSHEERRYSVPRFCCGRGDGSRGLKVMQFAGIDQAEALLAHVLKPRDNLSHKWTHAVAVSLVTGEVQIEMLAGKSIRHAGETGDWIFDYFPK